MRWIKIKCLENSKDEYKYRRFKRSFIIEQSETLLIEIAVYVTLRLGRLSTFLIPANPVVTYCSKREVGL